ncbi:hypothetical protein K469DRAFT_577263 [Zopfia rhizophila CBS 207.26]|uniref:Genetic interactor of prohibitins 3, mitochondrial n=1 Tax=Zopfia rhizophila CBS 207.26 TaxID=1314779 RepID=A0A6A6DZZ8_9PEZI|nr:hypothetical protein K469DRAFT_577263 [Zopfia rhizophila CBS 207.26]
MRPAFRQARNLVRYESSLPHASIPTFLCPALLRTSKAPRTSYVERRRQVPKNFSTSKQARLQAVATSNEPIVPQETSSPSNVLTPIPAPRTLPICCPGCGAPAQVVDKQEAGYYNIDRNAVKAYLNYDPTKRQEQDKENDVYTKALQQHSGLLEELGLDKTVLNASPKVETTLPATPICDRCHNLTHHHSGTSIHHPSITAIQETIAESPHRRNHIYHVLDAADFPLSLIPNLQTSLRLPRLRTQNRRARHKGWVAGDRIAEVSFIITRADLLAPLKEQVDRLMPYIQDVLRTALGRVNRKARLGNVRLVSAKRGWWTRQVKEDIWNRGGAGWMVGKVNVGKSNLFEVVFPKGRGGELQDVRQIRSAAEREDMFAKARSMDELVQIQQQLAKEDDEIERARNQTSENSQEPTAQPEEFEEEEYDPDSLLPPPQPYTPYPVLPLTSSLPGTTASPIRIPFGRSRGELIDLPGLARTSPDLATFVRPGHHEDLVMKSRIAAHRHILKPGQSLVLGGGLIRITPVTSDLVFLVHPFVPITPHVTSTEKAEGLQNQTRESGVESILAPGVGEKMRSAGRYKLQWDVTKKLAGPLTSPTAGKIRPENLPFKIWGTDILVEGLGWVEISTQVRRPKGWKPVGMIKKDPNHARGRKGKGEEDAFDRAGAGEVNRSEGLEVEEYPEVEVFSPLGKYVGARMPMCGSVLGGPRQVSKRNRKVRPRQSMVSVKRQRKPKGKG